MAFSKNNLLKFAPLALVALGALTFVAARPGGPAVGQTADALAEPLMADAKDIHLDGGIIVRAVPRRLRDRHNAHTLHFTLTPNRNVNVKWSYTNCTGETNAVCYAGFLNLKNGETQSTGLITGDSNTMPDAEIQVQKY